MLHLLMISMFFVPNSVIFIVNLRRLKISALIYFGEITDQNAC